MAARHAVEKAAATVQEIPSLLRFLIDYPSSQWGECFAYWWRYSTSATVICWIIVIAMAGCALWLFVRWWKKESERIEKERRNYETSQINRRIERERIERENQDIRKSAEQRKEREEKRYKALLHEQQLKPAATSIAFAIWNSSKPLRRSDLYKHLFSDRRHQIDDAIQLAVERSWIKRQGDGWYAKNADMDRNTGKPKGGPPPGWGPGARKHVRKHRHKAGGTGVENRWKRRVTPVTKVSKPLSQKAVPPLSHPINDLNPSADADGKRSIH